ncbi:MAG: helix-turn-helix transcriptional regulator [Methanococcaceae archaeon]
MDYLGKKVKNVSQFYNLSIKELEVIDILKEGKTDKEIAAELFRSHYTVNYHLKKIFQKLEVHSRSQVLAKILQERTNLAK